MAAGLRCIAVEQQVGKERLAARPRHAFDGRATVVDAEVAKEADAEAGVRSATRSIHRYCSRSTSSIFQCARTFSRLDRRTSNESGCFAVDTE